MRVGNIIQQIKYNALLNDWRWKVKAQEIKKRDGYRCQNCGTHHKLNVHHLVYLKIKPWEYADNYLITLCDRCHLFEHACLDAINYDIKDGLLSGMLAIDIYNKIKNNEKTIFKNVN